MSSSNQSPSYLEERERTRRWLQKSKDGQLAVDELRKQGQTVVLDDDKEVQWDDMVAEYKGAAVLAASNAEAREAFELSRHASSNMGAPLNHGAWRAFASMPLGYVIRRQIETMDPGYWDDQVNLYRECLEHPEWCRVPADYIRGRLNDVLPKGPRLVRDNIRVIGEEDA